jgi:elongator complex protein 3
MSLLSIKSLLLRDFTQITKDNLYTLKRSWSKTLGHTPKDSEVRAVYLDLVKQGKLPRNSVLLQALTTRGIRTLSGVTPFAVMTKPYICPGQCTFCPLELGMPKSYLSDEPAAARAKKLDFDPRAQIESRLEQLVATGHETDKIELIVIGGTFGNYPETYKRAFFKDMIDAVNGTTSPTLEAAQAYNETATRRIVGISIETRPDWIDETEVKLLRELGVTKLQVGVQALDEEILRRIKRGHSLEAVAKATRLLKDAGFKVCYHFMPNLPGSTPEKDVEMAKMMYEDERFQPDFVKIYPAQVIAGTELYRQWQRGEFTTYDDETMLKVLREIKLLTPETVRIDRLVRDISKKWVASGTHATNMRQYIKAQFEKEGLSCKCIRCREVKERPHQVDAQLVTRDNKVLGGRDLLFSFEKDGQLFSLLRLRLPDGKSEPLFKELADCAIIREVHTFGRAVNLGAGDSHKSQHQGFGTRLIKHAEDYAQEKGYSKMAVISSIGTRDYYRKFGYELDGLYMTKAL